MTKKLDDTHKNWIDPDEAPELTDEWFAQADFYKNGKLVRRGRPRVEHPKKIQSFKLSPDVIDAIKSSGKGFNGRVEAVLRAAFIENHP